MKSIKEISNLLLENDNKLEFKQKSFPSGFSIKQFMDEENHVISVDEFEQNNRHNIIRIEFTQDYSVMDCTINGQNASEEKTIDQLWEYVDQFDV